MWAKTLSYTQETNVQGIQFGEQKQTENQKIITTNTILYIDNINI